VGNHKTNVAEQDARPRVAWRHSRGPIARLGIGRHPPRALGYDSFMGQNASGADVVTTTYGYDAFGARVYQIASTTATTTYPFKFFSIASTTRSGTNYSTTTEYVFNGDTLLATVDQAFKNGSATGTIDIAARERTLASQSRGMFKGGATSPETPRKLGRARWRWMRATREVSICYMEIAICAGSTDWFWS
jgi:hypothetical protein